MELIFEKFTKRKSEELIKFLLSETWKYHGGPNPTREEKILEINKRYYTHRKQATFLINSKSNIVGFLRISGLENEPNACPNFDIRLSSSIKGKGIGKKVLEFMIRYIFENYPKIRRIEGSTREDNYSMQKLFDKVGFLKVGQFRKAWHDDKNNWYDCLEYDFLREEFQKR